jgi:glycosyltransferase involved in cell wall biosynthesis
MLSVIVPCYNEINTIQKILEEIHSSPINLKKQVIVVDDFSTDGTREALLKISKSTELISNLLLHDKNLGKGAAIRSAIPQVQGDIVIIQDADLEYSPSEYGALVEPITSGDADVVFGTRFVTTHKRRVLYFWHYVGNRFLTFLSNMFTNLNLTDMETCYKVFRTPIISNLVIEENRFGFEPEITAKIAKLNCRIYEVGISYKGRTYSEGKKIGWRDGFRAIYSIFKYNIFH